MRQLLQHQRTGRLQLEEVPVPECVPGGVLVRTAYSVISLGTERSSVSTAQASLIAKALQRPDLVRQVLDTLRREGLRATWEKVRARLDALKPLGYSAAGVVVESRTPRFAPGDRVACAGAGFAVHAEYITVPELLTARIPEGVSLEAAAYTTLGAIALHGIRQAEVQLGESVVVIGLGLLGLLTVELLSSAGCRVAGVDIDERTFPLAQRLGCALTLPSALSSVEALRAWAGGHGADAVIITASTSSNEPLELAIALARSRARIVVVGAVPMNVPRQPFYEKELQLRIARSYGPGRYDPAYELLGRDYPLDYVRWTEQRNMEAFLQLVAAGKVHPEQLTTHRFPFERALDAYELVTRPGSERPIGIVLEYTAAAELERTILRRDARSARPGKLSAALIGAGSFAQAHLVPAFQQAGVRFVGVATATPSSAYAAAERLGCHLMSTDGAALIAHPEIELVVCASRHDSHARYVRLALEAGKPIFVEKPLAISPQQLRELEQALAQHGGILMVGFNRRFSQVLRDLAEFFASRSYPMSILYRVNAGQLPEGHWLSLPDQGGRIIGEACHFIDCMVFLTNSLPVRVSAMQLPGSTPANPNVAATIYFGDGSVGTLLYLSNGSPAVPKEYCEVFCQGQSARMEDFRTLELCSGRKCTQRRYDGSKGHAEEVRAFVQALQTGQPAPIPYEQLRAVTATTFAIEHALRTGTVVDIEAFLQQEWAQAR